MTEKRKPRVILLVNNETILEQASKVLEDIGWDVIREKTSIAALTRVAKTKKPFALFITDSKLPRMEADDILKRVKAMSPYTQRMIMIPDGDSPDILINAINKAKVNACITLPFKADDLIGLSKNCLKKFRHAVKKAQLRRITAHQYKQLLDNAKKLKKKDGQHQHLVEKKQTLILKLKSKERALRKQYHLLTDLSLVDVILKKSIQPTPQIFNSEFKLISVLIEKAFTQYIETLKRENESRNLPEIRLDKIFERFQRNNRSEVDNQSVLPEDSNESLATKEKVETAEEAPGTRQIRAILQAAFAEWLKSAVPKTDPASDEFVMEEHKDQQGLQNSTDEDEGHPLDLLFELTISEDMSLARIQRKKSKGQKDKQVSFTDILDLLRVHEISYGIIDDSDIETWLENHSTDTLLIASGEKPDPGEPGKVTYEFPTDYTNPGKINEDGSIDFKDRGTPPYVKSGDILSRKTPVRKGKPGITVTGIPIPIDELEDPVFEAGPGTILSDDKLTILADMDGQPQVDKLGTVSVSQDMVIDGDVDYETGNIQFYGNIIVKGRVKEGFKITGASLTAQAVDGAVIDVSGDLNISEGITDTIVSTAGNIHAKFINQSKVLAFGDTHISKDIIDSEIMISGKFNNPGGSVIASKIWATLGIEASMIGTASSDPPRLFVGTYSHVDTLISRIDDALNASVNASKLFREDIKTLGKEEQVLYEQISEKAQVQDQAQSDLKEMLSELETLKESEDLAQIPMVSEEIKTIKAKVRTAEQELNAFFEIQDGIAKKIEATKIQLSGSEEENRSLIREKKSLNKRKKEIKPIPIVTVAKKIIEGTVIKSRRASVILKEDRARCRIHEIVSKDTGLPIYEMIFSDL